MNDDLRTRLGTIDGFFLNEEDLKVLREALQSGEAELQVAALDQLEGELDEETIPLVLALVRNREVDVETRARAAIAFGPTLETFDHDRIFREVGGPSMGEELDEELGNEIRETLLSIIRDDSEPTLVRRRALEASVRCEEQEHPDLVRHFWIDPDRDWRMTAAFCMGYVPGFEREIRAAIENEELDDEVRAEAIDAAAARDIPGVTKRIFKIAADESASTRLRISALRTAAEINAEKARPIVEDAAESDDDEIREMAEYLLEDLDDMEELQSLKEDW